MTSFAPEPPQVGDFGRDFGARAALYAARRPEYPEAVFERLLARLAGPRALAVDLGAGAGAATRRLAADFDRVAAVEPDSRMLAELLETGRIEKINAAAEDADFAPGSVDAVVAATSFHWMDQAAVCARVSQWLRPGGVFYPFLYGPFTVKGAGEKAFRRHRALWTPYRDPRLGARTEYSRAIKESGLFSDLEYFSSEVSIDLTPDDAAGLFLTASYASAYAAAHGGIEAYHMLMSAEFAAMCEVVNITLPLGGVLAVKASD